MSRARRLLAHAAGDVPVLPARAGLIVAAPLLRRSRSAREGI